MGSGAGVAICGSRSEAEKSGISDPLELSESALSISKTEWKF